MKIRKLLKSKQKINKAIYYNFNYSYNELNEYYKIYFNKYENIDYKVQLNIENSLNFELNIKNFKKIYYSVELGSIDFSKSDSIFELSLSLPKLMHYVILNLKKDYVNYNNGNEIFGLCHKYYEFFENNNVATFFLVDITINENTLNLFNTLNTKNLTSNQLFHSIIFSPSEYSESILESDIELYSFVKDIRDFINKGNKRKKESKLIHGLLFYFTFNSQINIKNFNYYCIKHLINNSI